jgi:mRNA interferase MazF
VRRGEIWWAELPEPAGSEPEYRRPVLIVQTDAFNRSAIATVIVVALTTNLRLAAAPGNVLLTRRQSGLPKDSVANVTRVLTLDRSFLVEQVGAVTPDRMQDVDTGLTRVLGLGGPVSTAG